MKVYAYLAIAAVVLASYAGTYLYGRSAGADSVRLEWEEANRDQRAREAAQASEAEHQLEATREKTRVVYRTITKEVEKYVDRIELRNVCLDERGVCLANAAIGGTDPTACGVVKPVPSALEAGERDGGGVVALDSGGVGALPGLR